MKSQPLLAARHFLSDVRQNDTYRILKYIGVRGLTLSVTVVVAVYLMILIANFGGTIDDFVRADIDFAVGSSMRYMRDLTTEERAAIFEERTAAAYEAAGLNTPFAGRCLRWLKRGLLLDWGPLQTRGPMSPNRDQDTMIRDTIFAAIPQSLLIFGSANLFLFFTTVFVALPLTNKQYGWMDRFIAVLAPLSAVPAWVYGIVLNLLILRTLWRVVDDDLYAASSGAFLLSDVLGFVQTFALPFVCIVLSGLFQGIYTWRMYFRLYASEDYVELGKAKGLDPRALERRYVLRPMLPSLITSFALLFVELWQQVIILEQVFEVKGIGRLFVQMLDFRTANRTPYLVAMVVTFAYLVAATMFVLDIIYVLVDPRIRLGSSGTTVSAKATGSRSRGWLFQKRQRDATGEGASWAFARRALQKTGRGRAFTSVPAFLDQGVAKRARALMIWLRGIGSRRVWHKRVARTRERLRRAWQGLSGSPSAIVGLVIVTAMCGIAVYTLVTIPYSKMLLLWRDGEELWLLNPKDAAPAWTNFFRRDKLPPTMVMESTSPSAPRKGFTKRTEVVSEGMREVTLSFPFEFTYSTLPQDVSLIIQAHYREKRPLVVLTWFAPDGREIELMSTSMDGHQLMYRVAQDQKLARKYRTHSALPVLFTDPDAPDAGLQSGTYTLQLSAFVFEEDADIDAKFSIYGQVFGLSGTDSRRRDLKVPLLWGMVMALSFGIVAAAATTLSSILVAAVGTWIGGWADTLVQRITEVNLIMPFLPVSVMIYILYSKSIWVLLGVTVALTVFGPSVKSYRALFLQVRESAYIEAARAYGASHWRIIHRYLIPRIASVLIPQLVNMIPGFVFLEASLAMLNMSDPVLPTWGKLVIEALTRGLTLGNYYLVLQPLALLMVVGFAFSMLGHSLEHVLRPHDKLR